MLVVLVILSIVLGGMTTLFVSASNAQVDQTNRVEAQQEARLALDVAAARDPLRERGHRQCRRLPIRSRITSRFATARPLPAAVHSASCHVVRRRRFDAVRALALRRDACSGDGHRGTATRGLERDLTCTTGDRRRGADADRCGDGWDARAWYLRLRRHGSRRRAARRRPGRYGEHHLRHRRHEQGHDQLACTEPARSSYRVYGRDDGSTTVDGMRLLATTTTRRTSIPAPPSRPMAAPPLATLGISLAVDASPANARQRYTLADDIVLRNSGRG